MGSSTKPFNRKNKLNDKKSMLNDKSLKKIKYFQKYYLFHCH